MRMQILIRAPEAVKTFLQQFAKQSGMPVNALVLNILREWIDKQKEKR